MSGRRTVFTIVAVAIALLVIVMTGGQKATDPVPSRVYWGAYNDGIPWDTEGLDAFEARVSKGQSIVHWGEPWMHHGRFQRFPEDLAQEVRDRGSIPMINWGSWELGAGRDQPAFRLGEISAGTYDIYIREWARDARDWNHPFFLRLNHEMNGWWLFPWAEQTNGNQPGDFVHAWRHVHDVFAEEGATNVTWVWAPSIIGPGTTPLEDVYPGDDYVDWVAMDGYNATEDNAWRGFAEVFDPTYNAMRKLAPEKPIMLAEWGSKEDGGDKAAWIEDALLVQLPRRFPEIKAVVWFNWNESPAHTYTIDSSPESLSAFRRAIASEYYAANEFSDLSISPIPPVQLQRVRGPTGEVFQPEGRP